MGGGVGGLIHYCTYHYDGNSVLQCMQYEGAMYKRMVTDTACMPNTSQFAQEKKNKLHSFRFLAHI